MENSKLIKIFKPVKTTKVDNKNGRVITSVSISLSKPAAQRSTNKIQLSTVEKKDEKRITYTRDFLMSRRSANVKNAPKMMNIDGEFNKKLRLFPNTFN